MGYYYMPVTGNNNLFRGTTSLQTVTIPGSVTKIGSGAFENSSVSEFIVSGTSKLATIDKYAFANCTNLTAFNYGNKLTTINEGAFMNCSNLETITLGSTLKTLQGMAFAFCTKLEKGVIPASVTTMTGNPYAGLDASKIELGSGSKNFKLETHNDALYLTNTGKTIVYGVWGATGAFTVDFTAASYGDFKMGALAGNAITSVTIKPKTSGSSSALRKTIPDYLFMNCTSLGSVTINSGFTTINQYAFYNTGLSTITFPSTVTKIGDYAFAYCASLDNVVIHKSITNLGNYCFAYCATLSNFTFEGTTTKMIGTHFFYNCPNITEVVLPSKIQLQTADRDQYSDQGYTPDMTYVLPSYMFAGTGIEIAELPASVVFRFYTAGVFDNCENLTEIRIGATMDQANTNPGVNPDCFGDFDGTIIWEWVEEEA